MKIYKYIIFAYLLLFFISACEESVDETNIIKIFVDNSKVEELKDISDWIDEIKIVPIKEYKGNYMSEIYKLFVSKGKYIVLDRYGSKKINLFDKNGNFLKNILKIGAGPNETLQIDDCWINNNGELEVYDYALKKVYQFDSLFVLKNTIKFPYFCFFTNLINVPKTDNYVGYASFREYIKEHDKPPYHIAFLDNKLNFTKAGLFYKKKFRDIFWLSLKNHFYRVQDTLRLLQPYENYVYNIYQSKIEKKYKIVYNENKIPDDVFESVVNKHLGIFKDINSLSHKTSSYLMKYTYFTGNWLENDDYIFLYSGQDKRYGFISFYNKNTNKVEYNAKQLCETQRYKFKLPWLQFYDQASNTFFGVIMGYDLKNYLYEDSKFLQELTIDSSTFYIIHVKLKNEIN